MVLLNMMANILSHEDLGQRQRSDKDALNLIQADGIAGAVVELGRARRLMVRDLLSVLNCTPNLQVGRDASGPEGVAAGGLGQPGLPGAPLDHGQHPQPV
jgi:hypothetical protein